MVENHLQKTNLLLRDLNALNFSNSLMYVCMYFICMYVCMYACMYVLPHRFLKVFREGSRNSKVRGTNNMSY